MEQCLSYVLITPYTVAKSRTGGVLSRLLSRIDLELVGAQMIAMDQKIASEYAELIRKREKSEGFKSSPLLADYVEKNLGPSKGVRHRSLLLVFQGSNPCAQLANVCGNFQGENSRVEMLTGESIRDTYADLVFEDEKCEKVSYFEPGVLTAQTQEEADATFKLISSWLVTQSNIIENLPLSERKGTERTLAIIKPDNWKYASSRPGMIIDMFSRTGLRIVGIKVLRMSVAQALEFYGPIKENLKNKLAPIYGMQAKELLESEFNVILNNNIQEILATSFGATYAEEQFERIVDFMSGIRPSACPPEDLQKPGLVKCMVLIYEGVDAVKKIRDILGPTDPTKAPAGTIRRDFGTNIRVNAAHASDSKENAIREMKILGLMENSCAKIVQEYINQLS
ncbi:nucleoside diphosphate kinase [Sphaerochaeta pleomorpha str. Grapes]|uniref:Nucleoside diphosphate kinase n=1 Tax=Sphaerochaeta pleomorpha (strain ATCC BAA-1885 / DSM 22778 / Grapes) TaxID=158190 RepID=G8QT33_SPHPG|nr:nucleoside-diphosphate kinase [Sphaerochaeta pleomorpha]AEV27938.1 nucleoside diphosphate kinase [Sphaerochaeta pleomorpha str. Grapes]